MDLVTCKARASYPHIFEPTATMNGDTRYEISLIFSKSDPEQKAFIVKLKKALEATAVEKWGEKSEGKHPKRKIVGGARCPIKDGDIWTKEDGTLYKEENPMLEGTWSITATNKKIRPGIVDQNTQPILDSNVIYGGCWVKAHITPFAWDNKNGKGLSLSLNHVQFAGDGEAFGKARVKVEDAFSPVEVETASGGGGDLEEDDMFAED